MRLYFVFKSMYNLETTKKRVFSVKSEDGREHEIRKWTSERTPMATQNHHHTSLLFAGIPPERRL